MKKNISLLLIIILVLSYGITVSATTPKFVAPKLPTIPNIKITLSEGIKETAKKAGAEAVKNIQFDWSKIEFNSFN